MNIPQGTIVLFIVIESVGTVVTLGIGVAAIVAWRQGKKKMEQLSTEAQAKARAFAEETEAFIARLKAI